ncbi:WYL domain-containing protein [Corynebacterium halotolerans]|uniref:WYL domain-containing protein n=1 Tax=Corynebacterium halotolerans TaxID=225326 RepID=UPI003CF5821D
MTRKSERLSDLVRMLNLIPYFESHPDHSLMEAARDLGRQPQEIRDDLNRLWCCGLPGHMPHELVDMEVDFRRVQITNSQGLDQPLRLTRTEAGALLLTLESLENVPGLINRGAVVSAASKIRGIMGEETAAVYDSIGTDLPAESDTVEDLREALESGRKLAFDYRSVSSDSCRRRAVSPARVFTNEGAIYLTAWDESVDPAPEHRTFRVDRMSGTEILPEEAHPHAAELDFDARDPFGYSGVDLQADLLIRPDATWLADYYPIELGETTPSGMVRAMMPVGSIDWFLRFALGQSDRIAVNGPSTLLEALRRRAELAARAYDEPSSHPAGG